MFGKHKNKIFLFFILISIGVSFYFVNGRYKAESTYKNYDIVADYDDFSKVGYIENKTPKDYFTDLAKNGVNVVSINETTINSMKKDPTLNIRTSMVGMDLVVWGDVESLNFITNGLNTLKDKREIEKISEFEIKIKGRPSDLVTYKSDAYDLLQERLGDDGNIGSALEYVGLGFDEKRINTIKSIEGLEVNLRPIYYGRYQDSRATMERFKGAVEQYNPKQRYIVFSGKEVYKNTVEDTKITDDFINWIKTKKISIGMIEASNQRGHLKVEGLDSIVKRNDVNKVRAFTTWDYLQSAFDYSIPGHQNGEELTNVYYRAISERNISVIYLKPFVKNDKIIVEAEKYGNVIKNLGNRLEPKGYEVGNVNPIGQWNPDSTLKVFISLGTVCAAVLLLGIIFSLGDKLSLLFFVLGAVLSVVFFGLKVKEDIGNVLFNLLAIVTYPSLALCVVIENYNQVRRRKRSKSLPKVYLHGAMTLLMAILITSVGALMEISYMSGTNYLAEINIFRGVKISQLLPLVIAVFIYAAYVGFGREKIGNPKLRLNEVTNVLTLNVKIWQVIIGLGILVVLALFILRGGNSNTKVPGIELLFRNLMEEYLPARPRTKALFIGFPSVFLLMYVGYNKRGELFSLILTLFVAIGQADIVNTFSHIRTPLSMSFIRVIIEFVMACILSAIMLVVVDLFRKGYDKYIAK
ncbi:DUF5693 family protein [Anaerosphaera multitolerans]|uniref:Spore gernimation protein n=1 Tax=Anaerosphaera multitolerans TaxID=2487351 RepID=A0A437S6E6_9FIRM|nr:DUF5693 family protein [Anaerosphaera multitolerans]RVU54575.1 spore gernimation protein [Anaerosphaera multitolerans]